MASWALGLSFIPCGVSLIVALVLALIVLLQRDDGVEHGKRRAAAALCVLGVWAAVAIIALVVALTGRAPRDESGQVTDAGTSAVIDLQVGDCVADEVGGGETFAVDVVPCTEPHRAEVYGTFDLDGEWGGRAAADRTSDAGCLQRFEPFVGERVRRSELGVLIYEPRDEPSFREDPGVICLAQSDSLRTGSVKGTGAGDSGPADAA